MTDHDTPGLFPDANSVEEAPTAPPTLPVDDAAPVTYPCVSCGRFVFPTAGTQCYWCKRNEVDPPPPSRREALTDA